MAEQNARAIACMNELIETFGASEKGTELRVDVTKAGAAIIQKHMTVLSIPDAVAELDILFPESRFGESVFLLWEKVIAIVERTGRTVSDVS